MDVESKRRRMSRFLLLLALLTGLLLRCWGLSHDLAEGEIYHPDTPKQIRAVERYLKGQYYTYTGHSDYDGYPLFHAHALEYLIRLGKPVVDAGCELLGLPCQDEIRDIMTLYWLMRWFNVGLSTLLIFILFRLLAENFNRRAAVAGAWLLALSPADMACAHFESGDTSAAFFATVSVYFAFRIYRTGRWTNYALAALAGMCAFASKYHAGMGLIPAFAAHFLRMKRVREAWSPASLATLVFFGLASVASLFLAIPSLFTHGTTVLREIVQFLGHVSSGERLDAGVREGGFTAKFMFSMHRNLPVLMQLFSVPVCLASLVGLGHALRLERRYILLGLVPVVYFLLGVSLRPLAHPIYHTLMTPMVFALAAVVLADWSRSRSLLNVVAWLALLWAGGELAYRSAREAFYFWHSDTRRIAKEWTRENVPSSFQQVERPYGFLLPDYGPSQPGPRGLFVAQSSIRAIALPPDVPLLKQFRLETNSLPFFRNPVLELYASPPAAPSPGFRMPVLSQVPSENGNEIVFLDGPTFLRNECTSIVDTRHEMERVLVTTNRLEHVVVTLQAGRQPAFIDLSVGGAGQSLSLQAGERRMLGWRGLQRSFPFSDDGVNFYRMAARCVGGPVRIDVAFSADAQGIALWNNGWYREAEVLLAASALSGASPHPALAALALHAAQAAGIEQEPGIKARLEEQVDRLEGMSDSGYFRDVFGIAAEYLAALPYLSWPAGKLKFTGCIYEETPDPCSSALATPVQGEWSIATPGLFLAPGVYTLYLKGHLEAPLSVRVEDGDGSVIAGGKVVDGDEGWTFEVESMMAEGRLLLSGGGGEAALLHEAIIRPDPLKTVRFYLESVRGARVPARTAEAGRVANSLATFGETWSLEGFELQPGEVAAGGRTVLRLRWSQVASSPLAGQMVAWVHFREPDGKRRFQGDRPLERDLAQQADSDGVPGPDVEITVPVETPPGVYRILVGLMDARNDQRLNPVSSRDKVHDRGIFLPAELIVRPAAP